MGPNPGRSVQCFKGPQEVTAACRNPAAGLRAGFEAGSSTGGTKSVPSSLILETEDLVNPGHD